MRGPTGCRYLADDRQRKYVRDGWNLTGDSFIEDEAGYFHFAARSDDMIISSGYNIAGPEVEAALLAHAHVRECAVIGVADADRGQIVEAHVVLVEGVAADVETAKLLQDHVKATIAPYKYPRSVKFTDATAQDADRQDPALPAEEPRMTTDFARTRALFHMPEGVIYMDGNSLGPLPIAAEKRVARVLVEEWGEQLIRGWNSAGWMVQPRRVGDRIGRLIGAAEGSVVMGDTLSIKVYQALASALELNPTRRVVLSDSGNFPSDLYMAQGLLGSLGRGHVLKVVEPEEVEAAIDDSVAVLMLTEVDYRSGRLHDM